MDFSHSTPSPCKGFKVRISTHISYEKDCCFLKSSFFFPFLGFHPKCIKDAFNVIATREQGGIKRMNKRERHKAILRNTADCLIA